ncbi:hypothetical protein [Aspergillus fumigatus polymycovirus 1]|uniref:Methyltransferase domain-containing protein n=1 Tax=Aspergillus fumigatus polymycovirus 1 TaxID=2250469 RepID=A0A7I8D056_9VIRU|nr:hypothetical protein [Aspergillus fumigatus polymycovirus 1]
MLQRPAATMLTRKRGVRSVPSTGSRGPPPPTRRPSETPSHPSTSGVSNLALSVRSRSTTTVAASGPSGEKVVLPFSLFEFGFPPDMPSSPLPEDSQFKDEGGQRFMASEAGTILRRDDRRYAALQRQFIVRSVRLTGSSILVLGSGSSKSIIPLLRRGVATATFVDTSQAALDRMRRNLTEAGITATVDAQFVCCDAWDWISGDDQPLYDVVIATKCLGLIFSSDPAQRDVQSLLDYCSAILRDDGSVFVDHHLAFASLPHGTRVASAVEPELFDLATIAGRYADDVAYNAEVDHQDFDRVASFVSSAAAHLVQVWQFFHYRLKNVGRAKPGATLSLHKAPCPTEFPTPPPLEFDALADAMYPVNGRGVKRIPTASDIKGHPYATALVKYDGEHGVLVLDGANATFISGRYRFARQLHLSVQPVLACTAELVPVSPQTSVLIITGLISLGDAFADPLDYEALRPLVPTLERLAPSGIVPTIPEHVRLVKGSAVHFFGPHGSVLRAPVDGVQVNTGGKAGVFIKPAAACTVDATTNDASNAIADAYAALGLTAMPYVHSGEGDNIYEFHRVPGTHVWRPGRPRPDKNRSDKPGTVVHTVAASIMAEQLALTSDVAALVSKIFR